MKQLWAPWRSEYITTGPTQGCLFCTAHSGEANDGLMLFNGHISMVMLNKYPYNNGHLMIAPSRHVAKFDEMTPEESIDTFRLLRHCIAVLTKTLKPDGFNIGINLGRAAGAGIEDHMHWHVVPRWNGDANFMPVVAEVKAIPQHLKETHSMLLPLFDRLS